MHSSRGTGGLQPLVLLLWSGLVVECSGGQGADAGTAEGAGEEEEEGGEESQLCATGRQEGSRTGLHCED